MASDAIPTLPVHARAVRRSGRGAPLRPGRARPRRPTSGGHDGARWRLPAEPVPRAGLRRQPPDGPRGADHVEPPGARPPRVQGVGSFVAEAPVRHRVDAASQSLTDALRVQGLIVAEDVLEATPAPRRGGPGGLPAIPRPGHDPVVAAGRPARPWSLSLTWLPDRPPGDGNPPRAGLPLQTMLAQRHGSAAVPAEPRGRRGAGRAVGQRTSRRPPTGTPLIVVSGTDVDQHGAAHRPGLPPDPGRPGRVSPSISVPDVTLLQALALAGAGLRGTASAMAGGASIITFPVLLAMGVPPLTANVTNTVGLTPIVFGTGARRAAELRGQRARLAALACRACRGVRGRRSCC